jgi:hypothetical protein
VRGLRRGLAAFVLGVAACSPGTSGSQPPTVLDHLPVASSFRTYHAPSGVGLLSSIVQVDSGVFLASDPSNVYRVVQSSAGYAVSRLAKPTVPAWNPLGLAYRDGIVYVANGVGRDVLALRLTGSSLTLLRRITNPAMRDAENVVAQPDGTVVVADQAGNSVVKFQADGALQWRVRLTGAHGLTASGGKLYVGSVTNGTITELDQAGKTVASAGRIGVSSGRYLWPVGLTADGGRILVTDAHNGTVTILGGNLQVLGRVGSNGPGLDLFNFPFAALPVAGGYLVVDTFKNRLVRTDRGWTILEQVALGPVVPVGRQRPVVAATDAHPETYDTLPGVDLAAALGLQKAVPFVGALNGLDHVRPDRTRVHLDLTDPVFGSPGQTWAQAVGPYVLVGASQRGTMEVIDPATGMFTFVDVGSDAWWRSGTLLLSQNYRRDLDEVTAPAAAAFARARELLAQGASRSDAFNQALGRGKARNWSQDLSSQAGQQFVRSPMTAADARRYYDAALAQPQQRAVELLEVKYLSGS